MKKIIGILILGGLFMSACNEDPIIQVDGFQTKPVIYSIIDSEDSVHVIRLGRFFSGVINPAITAKIPDSIYFSLASLKVTLRRPGGKRVGVPVEHYTVPDKNSGFYNSDGFEAYSFKKTLIMGEYPNQFLLYDSVFIEVAIPGLPVAKCSTSILLPPTIWSPHHGQQFIFIYPDNPMRVLWSGDAWNEIDVSFKIYEQYPDSTVTQSFFVQKSNEVHINGKYYEIKIPYEFVVQMLEKNLKVSHDVVRRYFGPFSIDVLTGNEDFNIYMKFQNGINDFNYNPFNNVENGIGMLSGKSEWINSTVYLDQASRIKFAMEPGLKKFSFIEY